MTCETLSRKRRSGELVVRLLTKGLAPSMDDIAVSLVPERQMFRRARAQHASARDQLVHPGEKCLEKRGRVGPVVADHQIDRRRFAS